VASLNREQLISFSGKDPERYYTGCVKTKFFCKLDEQFLPYWHWDRFIFTCTGGAEGATSRKVAYSIPDGVSGIFHRHIS
jgi:hypothetical protein